MIDLMRAGFLMLTLVLGVSAGAAAETPEKASPIADAAHCPASPADAAKDLWPMAGAFGPQIRQLKGKHDCGRWLKCVRTLPSSKDWTCSWETDRKAS